jgi:AcrR family transcriptional regulator
MSTTSAVASPDIEMFARAFDRAPELAELSDSARRVLAAAAALFLRRGATDTSIRDITARCGLTPGAFYRHFASKDDLLLTLVGYGHQRMEQRVRAAVTAVGEDPRAQLAAFVRAYVVGHLEQPQLAQVVRREYLHLSHERRAAVVRRRRALRAQLVGLLRAGEASGDLRLPGSAQDRTRVAVMLLDMCSRTSEWYHADSTQTPDQLADLYVTAALRLTGAHSAALGPG